MCDARGLSSDYNNVANKPQKLLPKLIILSIPFFQHDGVEENGHHLLTRAPMPMTRQGAYYILQSSSVVLVSANSHLILIIFCRVSVLLLRRTPIIIIIIIILRVIWQWTHKKSINSKLQPVKMYRRVDANRCVPSTILTSITFIKTNYKCSRIYNKRYWPLSTTRFSLALLLFCVFFRICTANVYEYI